jgi:hypothetical protein
MASEISTSILNAVPLPLLDMSFSLRVMVGGGAHVTSTGISTAHGSNLSGNVRTVIADMSISLRVMVGGGAHVTRTGNSTAHGSNLSGNTSSVMALRS